MKNFKLFYFFMFCFLFSQAQASVVVPNGSFSGGGNTFGADGFGHEWSFDTSDDGSRLIWSMPGLGMAGSFSGPQDVVNGFFIEFYDTSLVLDMTPSQGPEDFEYRTQFLHGESGWAASLSKLADRVRIDFTAPENIFLNIGDDFSAMVVFGGLYDPSAFTFTAGWLHIDSGGGGTAAEPSSLILLLLACMLVFSRLTARARRGRG